MADIFISYSKAYRALTEALAKDLEACGHTVWSDTGLLSGETFREVILRELDAAKAVIVIWSPASVTSDWVISEATRAKAQGKLITVRSADVAHGDIPPPFDVLHTDLVDNIERIDAAIAKLGVVPPPSAARPRVQAAPRKPESTGWRWLAAALVLAATIGGGYFALLKKDVCTAADWGQIKASSNLQFVRKFASECKGERYGELADEQLARRDKAAFAVAQAANTVAAFEAYLAEWPLGAGARDARERIAAINEQEEAARRKAEDDRNRAEEKRRLEAERRKADATAWVKAEAGGAISDWKAYLAAFSAGEHAQEAKTKVAAREIAKRLVRSFTGHAGYVWSVTFSPDGRFALSGSWDRTLKLWDVHTGQALRTFTGHMGYVWSVAFSPDGRFALSGSYDYTLKFWDVQSGEALRTFTGGHTGWVSSVAFSPDGRYRVSQSCAERDAYQNCIKGSIKLWVASASEELAEFTAHDGDVTSLAFSPDGRFVLSGSNDKTLKLCDVSEWTQVKPSGK